MPSSAIQETPNEQISLSTKSIEELLEEQRILDMRHEELLGKQLQRESKVSSQKSKVEDEGLKLKPRMNFGNMGIRGR